MVLDEAIQRENSLPFRFSTFLWIQKVLSRNLNKIINYKTLRLCRNDLGICIISARKCYEFISAQKKKSNKWNNCIHFGKGKTDRWVWTVFTESVATATYLVGKPVSRPCVVIRKSRGIFKMGICPINPISEEIFSERKNKFHLLCFVSQELLYGSTLI